MADDKRKRGAADRRRVAAGVPYEVSYFARKHGLSKDEALKIIKKAKGIRAKANADPGVKDSGNKLIRQTQANSNSSGSRRFAGATVVTLTPNKTPSGQEIWHVQLEGRLSKLTTSSSSASVMDEAVKIYSPALKRLAKK